ncbi:MAG: DUF2855 family protein [Actinomycetota bacterium]
MTDVIDVLEVRRDDLGITRHTTDALPMLEEGQVLLRVDRVGLTANNVTYGAAGDMVGYWNFFPSADDGWGRIPVWGFADVIAGDVDGVAIGTRVFGYLPMATHLVVSPTRVSPSGFVDGAAHRADLPAVYNGYGFTTADPTYQPDTEDLQAIFIPLFVTSFVLDDYLADNGDFGAEQIIISSASSKTSAGTALCTIGRDGSRPRVVGLTSPGRVEHVESLGCYDRVIAYDQIDELDLVASAFVDVAGNASVRHEVHRRLGDRLGASISVGLTHWDATATDEELPGPSPEFFFAPSQIQKRVADWGQDGYQARLGVAWERLLEVAPSWATIVERPGLSGLEEAYLAMVQDAADPSEASIAVLS